MTTMSQLLFVTLVADPDGNMPNEYTPLVGTTVGVPPDMAQPLPKRPGNYDLYGIRGYVITDAGVPVPHPTTGARQWAMCDVLDRDTRLVIRNLPPVVGWKTSNSQQVFRDVARELILLDVPPLTIQDILTRLFNAAKVEATAP